MKRIALIIMVTTLLAACMPKERTAEQITLEISEARAQISELNTRVAELENEMAGMEQKNDESGIRVTARPADSVDFETFMQISAIVEAVNEAMVSPESNGKIMKIHVKEGDRVSKGQLLVTLDAEIMENSLAELEKGLELTRTMYEKQKELYEQGVGSEVQYLQMKNQYESLMKSKETLESQMRMSDIRAPFAGYVEKIMQKEGEIASPGRQIIHLVNLSDLYIRTDLSENYMGSVQEKDTVWVSFPHFPNLKKTATITQLGKVIDQASRTFAVRIEMKNEDEKLKPNMLADLRVRNYYNPDAMLLPTSLIRQDLKGSFVFVARAHDGSWFAHKVYVETGKSDGVHTEITGGLAPQDLVIRDGFNQVRDGNKVMIVN